MSAYVQEPLGARLAAARRTRGMSQREVASLLRVPLWHVDRAEAGHPVTTSSLRAMAALLGVSTAEPSVAPQALPAANRTGPTLVTRAVQATVGRTLVLGSVVALVTIRLFTEIVPILPRAANFIDIPIVATLAIAALFPSERAAGARVWRFSLGPLCAGFLLLAVVSTVVNSTRTQPGPVLVFLYGFLAPFAMYAAVYRIWPTGSVKALSRTIVALGVLELAVVAFVDLPRFVSSRNPDEISGTFGTNAYQLVFFLLVFVTLVVGVAALEPASRTARFAPVLIVASIAVVLLAQYRSLLLSMAVAIVAITVLLGVRARALVIVGSTVVAFAIVFHYVAASLPNLKLATAASSLASDPGGYAGGRLRIAENVVHLYGDLPAAVLAGSGPGTYSSRAWQTFANAGSTSRSNVAGSYVTGLTNGQGYTTDVSEKYVVPQLQTGKIIQGSHAVSSPYSSYTSLLAEVGVLGFVLIVAAYGAATMRGWRSARVTLGVARLGDPLPAVCLATAIGFLTLVQMAALENWFEVTRVTFIAWTLLAVTAKELDGRASA